MTKMKAAVWVDYGKVEIQDVPVPTVSPEGVLVRVQAASLCSTDLTMIKKGILDIKPPVVIGHEVAGVIADLGAAVRGFIKGDRVALNPPVPCRKCKICGRGLEHLCRNTKHIGAHVNGGFAEYVLIDYRNAYKIPDEVSFQEASLTEPIAVCLEGLAQSGGVKDRTVVIFGDGPFGLIFSYLAQIDGAAAVTLVGHHDKRLKRVASGGITTINSLRDECFPRIMDATKGDGVDIVIDTTASAKVIRGALEMLGERGTLVLFSHYEGEISLNAGLILMRELKIVGSERSLNLFPKALALMRGKKIDARGLITHHYKIDEFHKAMEAIENNKEESIKAIIEF